MCVRRRPAVREPPGPALPRPPRPLPLSLAPELPPRQSGASPCLESPPPSGPSLPSQRRCRSARFHLVPALCLAPHDRGAPAATAFPPAACRRMAEDRAALTPVAQLLDSPPTSPPCAPKPQSQQGQASRLAVGVTCRF